MGEERRGGEVRLFEPLCNCNIDPGPWTTHSTLRLLSDTYVCITCHVAKERVDTGDPNEQCIRARWQIQELLSLPCSLVFRAGYNEKRTHKTDNNFIWTMHVKKGSAKWCDGNLLSHCFQGVAISQGIWVFLYEIWTVFLQIKFIVTVKESWRKFTG